MCQYGYGIYSYHIHPRLQDRGEGSNTPHNLHIPLCVCSVSQTFWLCGHILLQGGSLYPGQPCCLLKMDEFYYYGL